jgi:acylphosphatase
MNNQIRTDIFVEGFVQGVFFRKRTKEKIDLSLPGITGTVENLPKRNVKIVAEGDWHKISALIAWLKEQQGVEGVIFQREKYTGEFKSFEIKQ